MPPTCVQILLIRVYTFTKFDVVELYNPGAPTANILPSSLNDTDFPNAELVCPNIIRVLAFEVPFVP